MNFLCDHACILCIYARIYVRMCVSACVRLCDPTTSWMVFIHYFPETTSWMVYSWEIPSTSKNEPIRSILKVRVQSLDVALVQQPVRPLVVALLWPVPGIIWELFWLLATLEACPWCSAADVNVHHVLSECQALPLLAPPNPCLRSLMTALRGIFTVRVPGNAVSHGGNGD